MSQFSILSALGLRLLLLHHDSHLLGLCHLLASLHHRRLRSMTLLLASLQRSTFNQIRLLLSLRPGRPLSLSLHLNSIFVILPVRRLRRLLFLLLHDILHPVVILMRLHHVAARVLEHLRAHVLKLVQLPFFFCLNTIQSVNFCRSVYLNLRLSLWTSIKRFFMLSSCCRSMFMFCLWYLLLWNGLYGSM